MYNMTMVIYEKTGGWKENNMIVWFKALSPAPELAGWKPFIENQWFRKHFMLFVYCFMVFVFIITGQFTGQIYRGQEMIFSQWIPIEVLLKISTALYFVVLYALLYLCHEIIHIIVIYNLGDISITHSGIFLWIHTNAVLSKKRFWFFMSLPILVLSLMPFIFSFILQGYLKLLFVHLGLVNLMIASSDFINSVLILLKPNDSWFCRGFYKVGGKEI